MPTFDPGDIVRVPFPYTDRSTRQRRPALVVSRGGIGRNEGLLRVLMITSAENAGWPDDMLIDETREATGLPIPSIVRAAKIATVEAAETDRIGRLSDAAMADISRVLRRLGV